MLKSNPLYGYEDEIEKMISERRKPNEIVKAFENVATKATIIRFLRDKGYVKRTVHPYSNILLEDHLDKVLELIEAGKSASQIAAHLGGAVTRNAVIGFCNRRGIQLKGRLRKARHEKSLFLKPKPKPKRVDPVVKRIENIPPTPKDGGKTLFELTSKMCHHPLWRAEEPIGKYCGRPVLPGTEFCPTCYNSVYESLQ